MNRVLNLAVVATSAVVMASSQVDAAIVNVTESSTSGYTMTDGNTYVIQNSVSFSNSTAGGSGITVAAGSSRSRSKFRRQCAMCLSLMV